MTQTQKDRIIYCMAAWFLLVTALLLAGCVTTGTAPSTTKQAIPEAPCKASLSAKPTYPADILVGGEDIWTQGTALWADRKARMARELELETVVEGCTKPSAP